MNSQQICYLLLETAQNQDQFKTIAKAQLIEHDHTLIQDNEIAFKLCQILHTLQQEKNQFISIQQKQQQIIIDKIHVEKDQIIQDLLKCIYTLKKQNEQLKFQYRKRFKVIKNLQEKYQNLILGKNKKITEFQSIVKYLEGKIKYLEKKLNKFQTHFKRQLLNENSLTISKSQSNYLSPDKMSVIVSKQNAKLSLSRNYPTRNSLQDLTMPLTSSFVSLSKATSSSKTIARNRSKQNFRENCILNQNPRQSDLYSSFLASTQNNFNQNCLDSQINIQDSSHIKPVCLQLYSSSTSKYLTSQDLNNLQKNQIRNQERLMRKSQQINQTQARRRYQKC